jgi:hypothetical protein
VQTWPGWERFVGLKPKWKALAVQLSPFPREDVLTARAEAERAGGQPVIGLLLRILERYRNEPEAERVRRRSAAKPEPVRVRPGGDYKPLTESDREEMSEDTRALVEGVKAKLSLEAASP